APLRTHGDARRDVARRRSRRCLVRPAALRDRELRSLPARQGEDPGVPIEARHARGARRFIEPFAMMARKSLVQDLYAPEDLRRITTEDARREGTAAEGGGPPVEGPVALLAFHGMGQQVRYGTIEETIAIVNAAAERRGCRVALKGRRQLAFPQDRFVGCAELLIE